LVDLAGQQLDVGSEFTNVGAYPCHLEQAQRQASQNGYNRQPYRYVQLKISHYRSITAPSIRFHMAMSRVRKK
jgi:hypothetical protein